mmetsp:Transcript_87660/g.165284  ORF Transcript_87660/g.165284 Transcript_87660/m.165284 type:complete len:325 (-) Transcript_87660:32-1006(-)
MSREDGAADGADAEEASDSKRRRFAVRGQRQEVPGSATSASSSSRSTATNQSKSTARSPEDPTTDEYREGTARLWQVRQQLTKLVHDGRKLSLLMEQPTSGSDLATISSLAARVRTASPLRFPVMPSGAPSAPLPPGASLPYPCEPVQTAHALRTGLRRPPPPEMRVSANPGAAQGWVVHVRFLPPATGIIFTVDGSLPLSGKPATKVHSDSADLMLRLGPGGAPSIFARAVAQNMSPSDTVIVSAPKQPQSTPIVSVASADDSRPPMAGALASQTSAEKNHGTNGKNVLPPGPARGRGSREFQAMRNSILLGRGGSDDSSSED